MKKLIFFLFLSLLAGLPFVSADPQKEPAEESLESSRTEQLRELLSHPDFASMRWMGDSTRYEILDRGDGETIGWGDSFRIEGEISAFADGKVFDTRDEDEEIVTLSGIDHWQEIFQSLRVGAHIRIAYTDEDLLDGWYKQRENTVLIYDFRITGLLPPDTEDPDHEKNTGSGELSVVNKKAASEPFGASKESFIDRAKAENPATAGDLKTVLSGDTDPETLDKTLGATAGDPKELSLTKSENPSSPGDKKIDNSTPEILDKAPSPSRGEYKEFTVLKSETPQVGDRKTEPVIPSVDKASDPRETGESKEDLPESVKAEPAMAPGLSKTGENERTTLDKALSPSRGEYKELTISKSETPEIGEAKIDPTIPMVVDKSSDYPDTGPSKEEATYLVKAGHPSTAGESKSDSIPNLDKAENPSPEGDSKVIPLAIKSEHPSTVGDQKGERETPDFADDEEILYKKAVPPTRGRPKDGLPKAEHPMEAGESKSETVPSVDKAENPFSGLSKEDSYMVKAEHPRSAGDPKPDDYSLRQPVPESVIAPPAPSNAVLVRVEDSASGESIPSVDKRDSKHRTSGAGDKPDARVKREGFFDLDHLKDPDILRAAHPEPEPPTGRTRRRRR